jgi:RimJ/RimL family protein N-acetyltransferase
VKVILETARLRLRELVPADVDFLAGMLSDAEVMRYYPRRLTRELSTDWVMRQMERYRDDGHGLWLTEETATGLPVGQVGLVKQSINGVDETEVGYLIHRTYWRHGYASEAALGCRNYASTRCTNRASSHSSGLRTKREHLVFAVKNPAVIA